MLTRDELYEETAWAVIDRKGWIATPELLFALKQYTKEIEEARRKEVPSILAENSDGKRIKTW